MDTLTDPPPDDRVIVGQGTAESAWQSWPRLAACRLLTMQRWLPASRRLVVVAPHPDDELLMCGGLLALHGAQHGRSLVVGVTDGEASHGELPPVEQTALAVTRRDERRQGLARLDIGEYRIERLSLPDGALASRVELIRQRLARLLDPADLVVTSWRFDGHPDHEACGRATARACGTIRAELAEAPVWMWHWAHPGQEGIAWQQLTALRLPASVRAKKAFALSAHVSQLAAGPAGEAAVLSGGILARAQRDREYFFIDAKQEVR